MTLSRTDYSFLERQRHAVATLEALRAGPRPFGPRSDDTPEASREASQLQLSWDRAPQTCDEFYHQRQVRMDETARAVLANLWCTNRPLSLKTPEDVTNANALLRQLASESWQVALALEQTRIGYDDAAMRGKRKQEEATEEKVTVPNDA